MRFHTLLLIAATSLASAVASPAQAQQARSLNTSYNMALGDLAALIIPNFLALAADVDDPVLATFEPDPGVIDLEIFGRWSRVEDARKAVDQVWVFVTQSINPYLERRFQLVLGPEDYRVIYYDRTNREGPKAILIFSDGQFVMP